MTKPFRPMLAEQATKERLEKLFRETHLLASFKLDGIRALVMYGRLYSRSMKLIPNHYVQTLLSSSYLEGFDGELICGAPYGEGVFQRCSSAFMSHDGQPQFTYHVFDLHNWNAPYDNRLATLHLRLQVMRERQVYQHVDKIQFVRHIRVGSMPELEELEAEALNRGYEGLIVRDPRAPYKQGRSTLAQGWMLKVKRFAHSEACVMDFEELMHNENEAKVSELGYTKRSSEKAGKRPAGMLGALYVRDIHHPEWIFNIGSGFDRSTRMHIWDNRERYRGKIVRYKYLEVGIVEAPRHPIFDGWRDPIDL